MGFVAQNQNEVTTMRTFYCRRSKRLDKLISVLLILIFVYLLTRSSKPVTRTFRINSEDANEARETLEYAMYDVSPRMRRFQPGYMGKGVIIRQSEKQKEKVGYSKHAFNMLASDKISLQRVLPDYRSRT